MSEYRSVKYVGNNHLFKGKTALACDCPKDDTAIKVQFDDRELGPWAFGWHVFSRELFEDT